MTDALTPEGLKRIETFVASISYDLIVSSSGDSIYSSDIRALLAELRRLQSVEARAVKVLEPFAATGAAIDPKPKDDACWAGQTPAPPITFGHLRQAHTLYSEIRKEGCSSQDHAPPAGSALEWRPHMTDEQIKHMVSRFLGWRLPDDFRPDCGISFKAEYNEEFMASLGKPPMRHQPVGTNLFDAREAEQMVRYMLDGLPAATAVPETVREAVIGIIDACVFARREQHDGIECLVYSGSEDAADAILAALTPATTPTGEQGGGR